MDRLIERFQMIDIPVQANYSSNTLNIPDQPMLRHKRITSMEVWTVNDFPNSPVSGNPTPSTVQLQTTSFIGYTGDPVSETDTGEYVYRIPFVTMHYSQNAALEPFVHQRIYFDDLTFYWDKCQLYFPRAINTGGGLFSFVIGVWYTSRETRVRRMLNKAISGVSEESLIAMLLKKLMTLEERIVNLGSKR